MDNPGYFEWLLQQADIGPDDIYDPMVYSVMYHTEFIVKIAMDYNRVADGLLLRNEYSDITGQYVRAPFDGASVLEVLIGLVNRLDMEGLDRPKFDWLHMFLFNMGLFSSEVQEFGRDFVANRLYIMMNRHYNRDGSGGGLFVVYDDPEDMSRIELYQQMQKYLIFCDEHNMFQ